MLVDRTQYREPATFEPTTAARLGGSHRLDQGAFWLGERQRAVLASGRGCGVRTGRATAGTVCLAVTMVLPGGVELLL